MSHCTSGCLTQDHESYVACLRSKTVKVAYCNSVNGQDATRQKKFDKTNEAYRDARKAGLQPKGVEMRHVRAAEQAASGEGITVRFESA